MVESHMMMIERSAGLAGSRDREQLSMTPAAVTTTRYRTLWGERAQEPEPRSRAAQRRL